MERFWKIVRGYINDYDTKFNSFSILVKFQLDNENMSISANNLNGQVPLYKFKNIWMVFYKYCQSKKVRDYIFHYALLENINLIYSSIINNLSIIIFSRYNSMKPKYRLQQPRSILESKLLKNLSNKNFIDKISKYHFLVRKYELF